MSHERDLAWLPASLRELPFGSPEFKDENERIAAADEAACAPVARAMPTWVNLLSTMACNLKCFMCTHGLFPELPAQPMADAVYRRAVRELYPFAKTVQLSTYGEPLMTPRMDDKLDDLERHGCRLELVTNGTLMMRETRFRDRLLGLLELVTFSVDGATAATFESIRAGADFAQVMDNITRFADRRRELPPAARPRMNFNFTLMRRNVAEAARFVEIVHELGGDEIVFSHIVALAPSVEAESLATARELANEHMGAAREAAARLGVTISMPPDFAPAAPAAGAAPPARCGPPPIKCWFLWRRVYVLPDGDVTPCCLAGVPRFGTMMGRPFRELWNGPTYREFRARVFTADPCEPCRTCYLIHRSPDESGAAGYSRH